MLQTIPTCPEDIPFLFQIYASTRSNEILSWGWDDATQHTFLTMQWTAQQRSYTSHYPDADHRIIIYRKLRAGRIMLFRTEQDLVLVDLSLLPEFYNLGIGTLLIKELQSEAAMSGKPLRLSVLKTNPARRLYERLGFMTTGDNDLYDFMDWRMEKV